MTLDDLLYRRTNWGIVERDGAALRQQVSDAIGWPTDNRGTFAGAKASDRATIPVGSAR
jgi:hypothetical protein